MESHRIETYYCWRKYCLLNNDLDNRGNFVVNTTNSGGSFNASGRYHKVAGNFTVWYASVPYGVYSAASTLEFNGTANQNYFNRGSLNNALMNCGPGGQVTLGNSGATDWMLTEYIDITNGRILTGANRVNVINNAVTAVSSGNISSYVEGNLKRNLLAAGGSYDFPVGTLLRGYQRINFNINNPNTKTNMQVSFNNTAPAAYPVLGPECVTALFDQTALNHGVWNVITTPPSGLLLHSVQLHLTEIIQIHNLDLQSW
ncbi:MAG: hypothetical protein IPL22_15755 [Bacteroidetes bacterium]|nr:hypothetical protein [Bacteroidota bacterium]